MLSSGMIKVLGLFLTCSILLTILIIKRKINNPKTSYLMATINICLQPFRTLQIGLLKEPIDLEKAMKEAITETKLNDFGDLTFIKNYQIIQNMKFYKSLRFSNLGLVMGTIEMKLMMIRRLMLQAYLKSHESICSIPLKSPVFVIGVGRSGTTFLHHLLSLDTQQVRSPKLWELMYPTPEVEGEYSDESSHLFEQDRNHRAATARQQISSSKSLGDLTLEHIHELDSDLPEECIVGLSNEVPLSYHFLYTFMMNMTEYCKSLPPSHMIAAYRSYKQLLQLLNYQVG